MDDQGDQPISAGEVKRVTIKLGSQILVGDDMQLDQALMLRIAQQIHDLQQRGIQCVLVSSGAIATGVMRLKMDRRPTDLARMQAVAAVGQAGLMQAWHTIFQQLGMEASQVLVTREDFDQRQRYLNIRNCVLELFSLNAVPIVNENDSVSVEEICFGDNDVLASLLCNAVDCDLLVLLSGVAGLSDDRGRVVPRVEQWQQALQWVRQDRSTYGSGGMNSKVQAARMVTEAGAGVVIADGREPDILRRIIDGESVGTSFVPLPQRVTLRRRWFGMSVRPQGEVQVDDGAVRALIEKGKSLLPIGVKQITGTFHAGAVILIRDEGGREVARGLTNYSAEDIRSIAGRHSRDLTDILGHATYEEVIHRDNMLITRKAPGS